MCGADRRSRFAAGVDRPLSAVETAFEVPAGDAPQLGKGEFTLAIWMQSDEVADRLSGDLLSQYDLTLRRGFHLTLKSNPGVTATQANRRHLQFGIDDDRVSPWRDCGRPWDLRVHPRTLNAAEIETLAGRQPAR